MLKQLFKQIWVQRTLNAWLWIELLVVFVCLAYVVDYLFTTARLYFSPTGYDTEHVYRVYLEQVPASANAFIPGQTDSLRNEYIHQALARMRAYPGVEAVSITGMAHPYNRGSSNGSRGIDTLWVHGNMFEISPEYFNVFRITDREGRTTPLVEAAMQENTVIISAATDIKFAEGGYTALGSGLKYWGQEEATNTIRGITTDHRFDDFRIVYPVYYMCNSEASLIKNRGVDSEFCVRVTPAADGPEFLTNFRQTMKEQLRLGNIYLLDVESFDDLRTNYYRANGAINDVKTHIAGLSFLLLNIFLGVIGTFWIRTQQRRSEIGLRLALGSSRIEVRNQLLVEGLLLLLLAAIPAAIIHYNIGITLLHDEWRVAWSMERFAIGTIITLVLLAAMIIFGVWFPANQAMKIEPAEALHEE